jgi:hypothetical protein
MQEVSKEVESAARSSIEMVLNSYGKMSDK